MDQQPNSMPRPTLLSASMQPRVLVASSEDAGEAHEALAHCRAELEHTLADFDARRLEHPGDAVAAAFKSPKDAVSCAIRIQAMLDQQNAQVMPANRVVLGIGIHHHPGEPDEDWSRGHGLRTASALRALAQSNDGIFISAEAREPLRGVAGYRCELFGGGRIEGEEDPIHVYQVLSTGSISQGLGKVARVLDQVVSNRASSLMALAALGAVVIFVAQLDLSFGGPDLDAMLRTDPPDSIAVMPFSGDGLRAGSEIYRDTIPARLIEALSEYEGVDVASRRRSFAPRDQADDFATIGLDLGVESVLTGFASTSGDWLLARAAIVRVSDGSEIWSDAYYRRSAEGDAIVQAMTKSIARALALKGGPALGSASVVGSPAAHKAAFTKAKAELEDALKEFQKLEINETDRLTSLNNLASLYYDTGRDEEAIPLYREVLTLLERSLGRDHPEVAVGLNNLATAYVAVGRYDEAEGLFQRSLAIRERALGPHHPRVGNALSNLASLYHRQERLDEAEALYERALAIREKELQTEPSGASTALRDRAARAQLAGKYPDAQKYYEQALANDRKTSGVDHPRTAVTTRELAVVRGLQGDSKESESLFRQAIALFSNAFGASHAEVGRTLASMGELQRRNGRLVEAQKYHEESLEAFEQSLGVNSPEVAGALGYLVAIFEVQGREVEAESARKRQQSIRESYLGPVFSYLVARSAEQGVARDRVQDELTDPHPLHEYRVTIDEGEDAAEKRRLSENLHNLALLYTDQGRYDKAEEKSLRALEIRESLTGRNHPDVAMSLHALARVYSLQGRLSKADQRFKEALQIFETTLGPVHPHVARCWEGLAEMWRRSDRLGDAEYAAHRARKIRTALLAEEAP